MIRRNIQHCIVFFSLAFFMILFMGVPSDSRGGSFYSSIGLGIPRYFVSGQGAGMGGTGIAVIDRLALNRSNPAALQTFGLTRVSVEFEAESIDAKHEMGKVNSKYMNANGFHFLAPLLKNLSFGFGLGLISDSKYSLIIRGGEDDYIYQRKVNASGGLSRGTLSLSYSPMKKLHLGVTTQFNFGKFQENWKTDFISEQYFDATDEISTYMRGMNLRFGVILTPVKNLNLGLVYANKGTFKSETTITQASGAESEQLNQTVVLPNLLSIGTSYRVGDKFLYAADYTRQNWSQFETNLDFGDLHRYSIGVEFIPSPDVFASYFAKASYRLGFYYTQLYILDNAGKPMTELFLTAGIGLPFSGNRGRVDFSLQVGQRGNLDANPYQEKIIRFVAGITGGERWFVRRRR